MFQYSSVQLKPVQVSPEKNRDKLIRALDFTEVSCDKGVCAAEQAGSQLNVDLCLTIMFSAFEGPRGMSREDWESRRHRVP